jgi:hypothetical protein
LLPKELFVPELGVLMMAPVVPLTVELGLLVELVVLLLVELVVLLLVELVVLLVEDSDEPRSAVPDWAGVSELVECGVLVALVLPGPAGLWP